MSAVIERFRGNIYIVIPAYVINKKLSFSMAKKTQKDGCGSQLNREMSLRVESEISGSLHKSLQRFSLGSQQLACFDELECKADNHLYESADIVVTVDDKTQLAVVMLVLYDKQLPASQLLDRVSADKLVIQSSQDQCVSVNEYLSDNFGIHLLSSAAKVCLSTRQEVPVDILISYLASETYNSENMAAQLVSPELTEQITCNIAQYNSSNIYAGKNSVLRVDKRPGDHAVATLASDSVFLFILEILAFKESAVLRTNTKTIEAIFNNSLLEISKMEQLTTEFSATMPFWDIGVFHYITAQNLANKLDASFGIEKHFATYDKNQQIFQHKVNIRQAIKQGSEDQILFLIALILFVFEISPYLFTTYQRLLEQKWFKMSELYSILGSGISTWVLVFIIVFITRRRRHKNGS